MELIDQHLSEMKAVCLSNKVDKLYAFGSVLTDQFDDESDLDFIVSIDEKNPIEYAENYFELKFGLEGIFKRKIDLLEQKAMRNKTFNELVSQQRKLVYARGN